MNLLGSKGQVGTYNLYDASGTIATGGTAQLLLPVNLSRSFLMIQNISDTVMTVKFGAARLTASLSSGSISSVSVGDGGFGFTTSFNILPIIYPMGGGTDSGVNVGWGNAFVGCGQPDYPSPVAGSNNVALARPARLKPVMTAGAISSVTVEDGGAGYKTAPYLHVMNNRLDPNGCATASATSGVMLQPGTGASAALNNTLTFNGTMCPTDAISIFCAQSSKAFTCVWAP